MLLSGVTYPAGHTLLASELNGIISAVQDMTLYATKSANESRTNSTLSDDADLQVAVAANAVYDIGGSIISYGAGGLASVNGIKYTFTASATSTMLWTPHSKVDTDGTNAATSIWQQGAALAQNVQSAGAGGNTVQITIAPKGILTVGSTAGTLKFRWAQNTTNGTATIVYAGSALMLRRIG